MKKAIFLLAIVSLLVSCGGNFFTVEISNNSTKTVSYDYNGDSYTIAADKTNVYEVKGYTQPPKNVVDADGFASIAMANYQSEKFTFSDADELVLNVTNTLPVQVIIRAGNYIKDGTSKELTIDPNDEANAVIYTRNPKFTVTANYPATVAWAIDEEATPNEMMVIIR